MVEPHLSIWTRMEPMEQEMSQEQSSLKQGNADENERGRLTSRRKRDQQQRRTTKVQRRRA